MSMEVTVLEEKDTEEEEVASEQAKRRTEAGSDCRAGGRTRRGCCVWSVLFQWYFLRILTLCPVVLRLED
jgi:hypothetical protein